MDFLFEINDLVRIDDKGYQHHDGKIGEIIGFAEDAFIRKPGYAVQFDGDQLVYFVPESSLSPTGKKGTRVSSRALFWVRDDAGHDHCIKIREKEDFDTLRPIIHRQEDVLIVELPETYEWEYCSPFFTQDVSARPEFRECRIFIIDASRWRNIGPLGVGIEMLGCAAVFQRTNDQKAFFVGMKPHFYKILTITWAPRELPQNIPTLQEALQMAMERTKLR